MGDGRTLRVLLVDDEPDIRTLLRFALERDEGFDVVGEAGDGAEAIELAAALRPDVVVLDLMMPRMSGLEALPQIGRAAPGTTVVMLTAAWSEEVEFSALAAGAAACFSKTINITRVGQAIAALVRDTVA